MNPVNQALADERLLVEEIHQTPREYWPNLLRLLRLFRETVTLKPAGASFRQGWQEMVREETLPYSEVWQEEDAH